MYHPNNVMTRNGPAMIDFVLFFFNDPPPTEIYTLSLHDALPISFTSDMPPQDVVTLLNGLFTRFDRSEEHTSELQSQSNLVCRLLLEKKKTFSRQSKLHTNCLISRTAFMNQP